MIFSWTPYLVRLSIFTPKTIIKKRIFVSVWIDGWLNYKFNIGSVLSKFSIQKLVDEPLAVGWCNPITCIHTTVDSDNLDWLSILP